MPCSNLRFLVVEDHEFQRSVLVQLLRSLGAEAVYEAGEGHAALQVVRDPDRPVDIVISDLSMPGMDGMEFVRCLSETGVPVSLVLSSAVNAALLASVVHMARAYGVQLLGAVGKPVTAVKLVPLVAQHRARVDGGKAPNPPSFELDEVAQALVHNEIEPWFEPQVHLASGRVAGMYATARWRHPDRGLLEPDNFMPSIQARGLSDDLIWLMLRQCAIHCRDWNQRGRDLNVTVNLAFGSLADLRLAERVRQIAQNEGLEPGSMVLSVTEAALDTGQARALENLARLRMDGFGLAIDDFGSGAMAVEDLARVAFTEVEIRADFVNGAGVDATAKAGLAVGLDLAHRLGSQAVARGIHSKEQWILLHQWGCNLGRGPFIAEPMPAELVAAWLGQWRGSTLK